jgi:hypothetical protein
MTVVVKQYGERRTGTNYLRALLLLNLDVLPLVYILGDKHASPVALDAIWQQVSELPDRAFQFTSRATAAAAGPTTYAVDREQRRELQQRADAVTDAYRAGDLRYLITVKDPYAWLVSLAQFQQWMHGDATLAAWDRERLIGACNDYNERYRAWLALAERHRAKSTFVRHEDLLDDAAGTIERIRERLGALRIAAHFIDVSERVEPSVWDHLPIQRTASPFDRTYYTDRRYLARLLPGHIDLITRTIDWKLFATFEYAPLGTMPATASNVCG